MKLTHTIVIGMTLSTLYALHVFGQSSSQPKATPEAIQQACPIPRYTICSGTLEATFKPPTEGGRYSTYPVPVVLRMDTQTGEVENLTVAGVGGEHGGVLTQGVWRHLGESSEGVSIPSPVPTTTTETHGSFK